MFQTDDQFRFILWISPSNDHFCFRRVNFVPKHVKRSFSMSLERLMLYMQLKKLVFQNIIFPELCKSY